MTIKKKTTPEKFREIKLSDVAQADDFVDIHIDVPEDMEDFFNKHQKILLPRILPLLVTMNLTKQVCFSCYITVNGKRYAFAIGESKPDGTPLN